MRHNGPVTQQEFPISPARCLVSSTDLQGRITYCNAAFIDASGYTREELLGQPHNMIRHPDMPAEAFRDLWATVSSGRPWSALVKNRRKNGDHYWVRAHVTPLMDGNAAVGYLSVRGFAERDAVQQADALYERMRSNTSGASAIRFNGGRVVRPGWPQRIGALDQQVRKHAVVLAAATMSAIAFAAGTQVPSVIAGALTVAAACALTAAGASRWLGRPMAALLAVTRRMAAGDLRQDVKVTACGTIGDVQHALAQLNVNLQSIVGDARSEVDGMLRSITEIADGNHEMSARTESQASSLEQTAASMEEITGTVRQSAEVAEQAATLAEAANEVSQSSMAVVQRVSGTMKDISESSRRIADISGVIDGIAFQTNLLALNAAVEAARVGEQGRGFAVVAGEVRALAARTANAAREIRGLVDTAQGRIDAGVGETELAARTIRETADSVTRVTRFMQEIRHGSNEQLTGISQVNEAVSQLDAITQQNAAMVEQLSASASALRGQARMVSESVHVFHTGRDDTPRADAAALRRMAKGR